VHPHAREDEHSLVLEGTIGVEIDGHVLQAGPGEIVVKPRDLPHAFWNPTDQPVRILGLISPGCFESYFAELGGILSRTEAPDLTALGQLAARYALVMEPDSIGRLASEPVPSWPRRLAILGAGRVPSSHPSVELSSLVRQRTNPFSSWWGGDSTP
jgi:hypothetical protein